MKTFDFAWDRVLKKSQRTGEEDPSQGKQQQKEPQKIECGNNAHLQESHHFPVGQPQGLRPPNL